MGVTRIGFSGTQARQYVDLVAPDGLVVAQFPVDDWGGGESANTALSDFCGRNGIEFDPAKAVAASASATPEPWGLDGFRISHLAGMDGYCGPAGVHRFRRRPRWARNVAAHGVDCAGSLRSQPLPYSPRRRGWPPYFVRIASAPAQVVAHPGGLALGDLIWH
jgi:hypothetical protein